MWQKWFNTVLPTSDVKHRVESPILYKVKTSCFQLTELDLYPCQRHEGRVFYLTIMSIAKGM
jgi:hypothetical protein